MRFALCLLNVKLRYALSAMRSALDGQWSVVGLKSLVLREQC